MHISFDKLIINRVCTKKQINALEEELDLKDKELYDLKHELISTQIKLENAEKTSKGARDEMNDLQKRIVKLETELDDKK